MTEVIKQKTRDWDRLLTYTQQKKYKNAIRQGYFSDYKGLSWRHDTFFGAFIWKHPNRVKIISRFKELIGHNPTWDDMTDDNLRDLYEELQNNYSPNSVRTICSEIKAVIRENDETREIPSPSFGKILRAKQVPAQAVYLTEQEIKRIVDYNPRGRNRRYVRRMFLIECLAGARMSDCENISEENIIIDDSKDSGKFLTYVSKKSKVEVKVPIHKWLRPFLVCGTADEPIGGIYINTFNRILRSICKDCGINEQVKIFTAGRTEVGKKWQFVSSHTGRRSFATNLSKRGVPIEQIANLMGHMNGNLPNTQMTQRYIVGKVEIDSNVMKVFGAYDDDDEKYQ